MIFEIRGEQLAELLAELTTREGERPIHTVRFAVDGDRLKLKVNEGMWGLDIATDRKVAG